MKARFLTLFVVLSLAASKVNAQSSYLTGEAAVVPGATEYYEAHFEYSLNPYTVITWSVTGGTIIDQGVNPTSTVYCIVEWDQTPGSASISVYEDVGSQSAGLNITIGGVTITPLSQTVYYNATPAQLCADFPGATIVSFQWWQSTDGTNWSPISGATSTCYQPPAVTVSNTLYYCVIELASGFFQTDNVNISLYPFLAGQISATYLQPAMNATNYITDNAASGGLCIPANYSYTWEQSYENGSWTVVGTGQSYPGGSITTTGRMMIRRKVVCNGQTLYSNVLVIIPNYTTVDNENLNYVRENSVLKKGTTSWYQADALTIGDKFQSTTYLDGLGRTIQKVDKGISPSTGGTWKDVVKHYEYDEAGRMVQNFVGYATSTTSGKYKSNAASEQPTYVRNFFGEPGTAPTSSIVNYDNSPLNRVVKAMAPGHSWAGSSKGVSTEFDFNEGTEQVRFWELDYAANSIPTTRDVYTTGQLFKIVTVDEKNNKVIRYTDFSGQLILEKVQEEPDGSGLTEEHVGWVSTYYVYDDFGKLRFTITPKAVKYLDANGWTLTQEICDELCFVFLYDERGRLIVQKKPGAGEESFVYDKKDRLVLSRNAQQKANNQWIFTHYDELGRVVATGLFRNTATRDAMQSHVNSLSNGTVTLSVFVGNSTYQSVIADNPVAGSTNTSNYCNGCQASTLTYNSIIHYDSYSYTGVKTFNTSNSFAYTQGQNANIDATEKTLRINGMVTGEKIRVIDFDGDPTNDVFQFGTSYYDENGRTLQILSDNIKGASDYQTLQYEFSGRIVSGFTNHANGSASFSVISKFEFDKAGRLTKLSKNFNNTSYKQLAEYSYDELGQLKIKKLAPGYNGTEIESVTYDYNIQGWLTGINKDYALSDNIYTQWDKYFGIYLGFDNRDNRFSAQQLNGNLTGVIWRSQGDNQLRKYTYEYDRLNRFVNALFAQKNIPADSWYSNEIDFSTYVEYEDGNGNIQSMKHMGIVPGTNTPVIVDELSYIYKLVPTMNDLAGNRLAKVTDNGAMGQSNGLLGDFKDGSNTSTDDYDYDESGNLLFDKNKNIQDNIIYNYLGKVEKVIITNKSTIEFTYDASGEKLKKKITYADNSVRLSTYIGDFVYEQFTPAGGPAGNDNLQFVLHEEGRLKIITPHVKTNDIDYELNNGNYGITWPGSKQAVFEYFLKDHLGNTRMVLTEEKQKEYYKATVEQSLANDEAPLFGEVDVNGAPASGNELNATRATSSPWPGNSTHVSKLTASNADTKIGPNMILKVMAGDIVNAYTDYYYINNSSSGGGSPVNEVVGSLVNSLAVPRAGGLNHSSASSISSSLNNSYPLSQFINGQSGSGNTSAPKAFLNVIFLDEQFKFIDRDLTIPTVGSDYLRVNSAGTPHYLQLEKKAPRNGWVFIYLSNESNENVYFDNFTVTQDHSRIAEEDHYYPYGLKIAGISSRAFNKLANNFDYQGEFAEYEVETGWNEFDLRMYDPQIGRWTGMDPYDEFSSPFIGMGGDPVNNVDPTGGDILRSGIWGMGGAFAGAILTWAFKGDEDDIKLGTAIGFVAGVGASLVNWESVGKFIGDRLPRFRFDYGYQRLPFDFSNVTAAMFNQLSWELYNIAGLDVSLDASNQLQYLERRRMVTSRRRQELGIPAMQLGARPVVNRNGTSRLARNALLSTEAYTRMQGSLSIGVYQGDTNPIRPGVSSAGMPNWIQLHPADWNNTSYFNLTKMTWGVGMAFLHEFGHTQYGGLKKDPGDPPNGMFYVPGDKVKIGGNEIFLNRIRKQLGSSWGKRLSYHSIGAAGFMPFDKYALKMLKRGLSPYGGSYIQ